MVYSDYLGDKKFWKQTAVLAIPIALQNLLVSSFVLVDNIMVGQLGDIALSSVGMAGQWSWLLNIVSFGICSGTTIFVSQFWGAKDIKSIHKVSGLSILIGVLISVLFVVCGCFFPEKHVFKNCLFFLSGSCFKYNIVWDFKGD